MRTERFSDVLLGLLAVMLLGAFLILAGLPR